MTPEQQIVRDTEDPAGIYLYEDDGSIWRPAIPTAIRFERQPNGWVILQQLWVLYTGPRVHERPLPIQWRDVPIVEQEQT